ncbi:MAG: Maf family protein [Pseudomonadota bacterium]
MTLVLASASHTRSAMLQAAGVNFVAHPVRIDETAIKQSLLAEGAGSHDIADTLAEYKARRASTAMASGRVLGCDQVLDLKGRVFDKPTSREDAHQQLMDLSGQQHKLLSAAVLYEDGEPIWRVVGQARLSMHVLTGDEIAAYLDRAWPNVATSVGAYQAEGLGAQLFSRIDGDWFSVLGLPLLQLLSFLRLRGWLQ